VYVVSVLSNTLYHSDKVTIGGARSVGAAPRISSNPFFFTLTPIQKPLVEFLNANITPLHGSLKLLIIEADDRGLVRTESGELKCFLVKKP
jgi:hypothetical protein